MATRYHFQAGQYHYHNPRIFFLHPEKAIGLFEKFETCFITLRKVRLFCVLACLYTLPLKPRFFIEF